MSPLRIALTGAEPLMLLREQVDQVDSYLVTALAARLRLAEEVGEQETAVRCPACDATLQDFRETGRLGCPICYDTFAPRLRDLLRRLHGSSHHVGQRYARRALPASPAEHRLSDLREQLRRAVDSEHFELAAEIRDRIRVLE